jgi:hypothetical protein
MAERGANMSKTPRTDAEFKFEAFFDGFGIVETIQVEFARQLEAELADKDKQLAETQELYIQLATELKAEHAQELAEMRAEIERKDKLIEQMREALSLILEGAIHDFHYVCQHRDNCLCWGCQKVRVKAALSAAERGE